ncbi:hypothetical protein B0H63DRAFT_459412 [Podospora didyma]|uniref:Uncharacterized protein n=1 Tax=Podospora didyma TaxID=330526 RepID=A0AAE0U7P4_9PEZI|nr:hypothetical protein B0H63DRAFT_459412 [Podospora didyma]
MAMLDQDDAAPSALRPRRSARHSAASDRDRTSADNTPDSTLVARSSDDIDPVAYQQHHQRPPRPDSQNDVDRRRSKAAHRTHKHRSSGGFLLADPVYDAPDQAHAQTQQPHNKRHRTSVENYKGRSAQHAPKGAVGLGLDPATVPDRRSERGSTGTTVIQRDPSAVDAGSSAPLDIESAQIVNMALNLSESRRLASRRNVSQPIPPRLTPLPDSSTGGSLRQHLQQQRRISRTISPRPDRSPRVGPGRVLSPLQSAFESDGSYRYHFSQSTLARAQKAKEYLELMAQYRRVLDLLPPLKPTRGPLSSGTNPYDTPNGSVQLSRPPTNEEAKIGRPYDPLQYIRNRKVRARERKVIDGEAQGFNDVVRVSEWVDDVSRWVATGQVRGLGDTALPLFSGALIVATQSSPPTVSSRPAVAATKPKRPRVDWVIDPADMLADVYWLEQDDNKKLVEDRHWRRVFSQDPELYRPLSREDAPRLTTPGSLKELSDHTTVEPTPTEPLPAKAEHEHVHTTARDRAQQKLRALKSSHHRQNSSSVNSRDLLRIHRGSLSESSDTDSDRRRRARAGTVTSSGEAILAKQMEEMIAREQRDVESHPLYDHGALHMKFANQTPITPEQRKRTSPIHSGTNYHRVDSHTELSEAESRHFKSKPPSSPQQPSGRASLEVPYAGRRFSIGYDTSLPNSPDLQPVRDVGRVPAIGMDLSPQSSRPSSPTRNPLNKVRSIFRERSRDRVPEVLRIGKEDGIEPVPPLPDRIPLEPPAADKSAVQSPERRLSRSPLRKIVSKGTDSSYRSHRSTGSVKLRGEDGGSGLRSLFLRPRIDSVLRNSVSKVSDMIWRKDGAVAGYEHSSSTSSDDSESEPARGRSRGPDQTSTHSQAHSHEMSSHSAKSYLDMMPQFLHTPEHGKAGSGERHTLSPPGSHPASRPLSRRSSRFDLLKPPRIDVQNASPGSSPPPELMRQRDSDGSDSDSRKSKSYTDGVRAADARLNAVLSYPKSRQFSSSSSARQWSIADRAGILLPVRADVSKREIARLRAVLLSSGIHAMEMDRRAKERKLLTSPGRAGRGSNSGSSDNRTPPFSWTDIVRHCPDPATRHHLLTRPVAQTDLYPLAASILGSSIQTSANRFSAVSGTFTTETAPKLERRVEALRSKIAGQLTDLTQMAADEADEANQDLASGQRLKVKRVVDVIEKMLRRRRRRFRWVRRAGWLAVEWVLVGFMWYVWFVVMITRVLLGVGKGVGRAAKWLLWL